MRTYLSGRSGDWKTLQNGPAGSDKDRQIGLVQIERKSVVLVEVVGSEFYLTLYLAQPLHFEVIFSSGSRLESVASPVKVALTDASSFRNPTKSEVIKIESSYRKLSA
ncbi:hypothetical protein [Allosphingosinicella sp.]|uniref:hypothetical protein n=1 Tax=Allosphingosinicella sp. TaxID=2823234 RepID=UPI002FC14644